jgi:hypothetical protein
MLNYVNVLGKPNRPLPCRAGPFWPIDIFHFLFKALVETKLFNGLGTWRTPTLKQMQTLRTFFINSLKKVLRMNPEVHLTNAQVLELAGAVEDLHCAGVHDGKCART